MNGFELLERTIHDVVIETNGSDLARRMGENRTRLLDCANPNREAHRMSLQMLFQLLVHVSQDDRRRILSVLVGEFGFALEGAQVAEAQNLTAAVLTMTVEIGDVAREVIRAMADGKIDQVERRRIEKEVSEARTALDVVEKAVRSAA